MKTVGMITIGQAPRDDIVPEMEKLLGPAIRVVQAGALDGLSREEVAALAPASGQDALTTRLADGTGVIVAKQAILERLQACLDRLASAADAFVILCTGKFPAFRCARPILEPDRILLSAVNAVFRDGALGILIPIPEQREDAAQRWSSVTSRLAIVVASPYREQEHLVRAAVELKQAGVNLIVMDCMGCTEAMKQLVRDIAGVSVILPGSLIARFVAELV